MMAKTESWQKDMWSYQRHCHNDSYALANDLRDILERPLSQLEDDFYAMTLNDKLKFEIEHEAHFADLLKRSETQRDAFYRKLRKTFTQNQLELFILFGIIIAQRVNQLIEFRDDYRGYLVPGGGKRITAQSVYKHSRDVVLASLNYEFPDEILSDTYPGGIPDDDF